MPVSGNAFLHWLTPRRLMAASAAVACAAIALKALAWQLTGSVGLLSDALESVVNLAGAGFGLLMLTVASRPADEGHPYGHYKAEYFASAFEGLLILAAAAAIAWAVLAYDSVSGKLVVLQLFDQQGNVPVGTIPLFMVDMWEHAFYLDYLNVKADYLKAVWNIANWQDVAARLADAVARGRGLIVR